MARIKQSDVSEQDVYGLVTESARKLEEQLKETNKALNKQASNTKKLGSELDKLSQKGIDNVIQKKKTLETLTKKAEKTDKISIKNAKLKEKALKQEAAAQKKATIEKNKAVRASIKKHKSTIAESDSNKRLNVQLRNARNRLKRLTIEYGKNNAKTIKATRNYDRLEKKQRELNATTKRGTKSLKLFGLKFNTVRGSALRMLGALGLLGGGFALIRGSLGVLTEFDEKLADIQKTTGLTKKGAREVSIAMLDINTKTAVSELQELISAGGRLGIEGTKNLVDFATSADKVFVALGDDLDGSAEEIATELGKISSLFNLDEDFGIGGGIERVGSIINELAATSKAAAQPLLDFTSRVAGFSDVLKIEEVAAFGTIFDEGGVSMEIAASTMNKVLPNMVNDITNLAKVTGLSENEFRELLKSNPAQALIEVAKAAKGTEGGLEELVNNQKLFGKVGTRALPVLNALTNGTDDYAKFLKTAKEQLDKNNSVTDEFNTKNNTLSATIEKAKKKLQEQIIAFDENTNATEGLKNAIVFLVNNMGTIVTVLVKVIKFYALYRAALIALKISNHIKELRTYNKGLKQSGVETSKLSKGAGKLKGALKGIGWAAATAAVTAWAQAIFSAVTEAGRLEKTLDAISKKTEEGSKLAADRAEDRAKNLADRLEEIALSTEFKTEKARAEAHSQALKSNDDLIRADIKLSQSRQDTAEKNLAIIQAQADKYDGFLTKSAEAAESLSGGVFVSESQQGLIDLQNELSKAKGVVEGARTEVRTFKDELNDSSISITTNTRELAANTSGQGDSNSELEKKISLLRDIEDEQISQIENEQDRETIKAATDAQRRIDELAGVKATEEEKAALIFEIRESLLLELTRIHQEFNQEAKKLNEEELDDLLEKVNERKDNTEINFQQEIDDLNRLAKEKRLLNLESDLNDEELAKKRLEEEIKLLEDLIKTQQSFGKDSIDNEISLAEKKRQIREKELAAEKEQQKALRDLVKDFADKALDEAIKRSGEKQELIQGEINRSQQLEDRLREAAQNGNAIASESLAEQSSITEQKQREKIREAKREERIEELKALWNTLNSLLDQGDNPAVAGGKAISIVGGLKKLFSGITGFATGTKGRLGDEHKATFGGVDGHIIRADGSEGILTGSKMDRLAAAGLHTTNDIVNSAIMNQQLVGVPMANPIDDRIVGRGNSVVENKLDAILDATKKNVPPKMHPAFKQGMLDAIVEIENKNGKVIRTWTHRS